LSPDPISTLILHVAIKKGASLPRIVVGADEFSWMVSSGHPVLALGFRDRRRASGNDDRNKYGKRGEA
jgi:hypothetical protein